MKRPRPRAQHFATARRLRAILAERFPSTFTPSKTPFKRPLKIGIHVDLREACGDLSSHDIHVFLKTYTSGRKYNACLAEGADRLDLDGIGDGVVTPVQAQRAAAILRKIDQQTMARGLRKVA
jgi:ProP effector